LKTILHRLIAGEDRIVATEVGGEWASKKALGQSG
jgi:hypothetical protein